jgi:hypothetical protein
LLVYMLSCARHKFVTHLEENLKSEPLLALAMQVVCS